MESEWPYNPYKHQTEMWGTKECDKQCKACIYAEGRKAERERCARLAKLNCTVEEIVDMIMGGQDGE
jgi:hypothetical protein